MTLDTNGIRAKAEEVIAANSGGYAWSPALRNPVSLPALTLARDVVALLDDRSILLARVPELEAERDALAKRVDEVAWTHHADDYVAHRFNQEWDRAEAAEARVRVQAEQIAALQEALKEIADLTVNIGDSVEAATRASVIALEALALAEGCAAPADEEEK